MTDENLPDHFRALEEFIHERYRRTDARFDEVVELQQEMLARLGRLEQGLSRVRRDQAGDAETA